MRGHQVAELKRWWQGRPGREKLMLGACTLGVALAMGDNLLISPLEKQIKQARATEAQLQSRRTQQQARQKDMAAQEAELARQEKELRRRLNEAQLRAGTLNARLAETAQLPETLRALVNTMGQTKLLELTLIDDTAGAGSSKLTAAAVIDAAASALKAASTSGQTPTPQRRVYQLPITLKVSGRWDDLTALLNTIETKAPALQWQSLSLDNAEWPAIQLTLRAHVASLQPRWGMPS